jgi:AraC family transcriptional regulator
MTTIDKAFWYLTGHFAEHFCLDDVARAADVSRHHMAHAFGCSLGLPVMAYARALRLSQAARELAAGAPEILKVALDAGYGSHEAFTRAFREQFGLTPEALRAAGTTENLKLMEPIRMAEPSTI